MSHNANTRTKLRSVWKIALLSAAAVMLLSACNSNPKEESQLEIPVAVETPVEEPATAEGEAPYTAPLTGMPLEEPVTQRPLAVMINNAPAARPQSGLGQADIVVEVLAEGGITRLVGIYQSQSGIDTIGPIRSIRPYLIELGESYGGLLVHAGGSPEAYAIIQQQGKADLDEIGNAGAYFWRDSSRKAPHNLYASDEKLREGADKLGYSSEVPIPEYTFYPSENAESGDAVAVSGAEGGEAAAKVELTFLLKNYVVGYEYDPEANVYKRTINGNPHIDLNDNEQLKASNVMVLGSDHKVLDDVGRLGIDLERGGEAMLFQNGRAIKGQWVRAAGDVIRFVKDGQEVPFVPGTTYLNIVPNDPPFESHLTITNP